MNALLPPRPYHPATFQERGVAVPFTSPLLNGTRARAGQKQTFEIIVQNPSGGAGVYVMPWTGIDGLCRPTLHDKVLGMKIAVQTAMTPASIRQAARATAAEGLAGETAMEMAVNAAANDQSDRLLTNAEVLLNLLRQVNNVPRAAPIPGMPVLGTSGPGTSGGVRRGSTARQTIEWLAPRMGMPTAGMIVAMDAIADVIAAIGMASGGEAGSIPRLMKTVRETNEQLTKWSLAQPRRALLADAKIVGAAAELTLSLTTAVLEKARAATADLVGLLRSWTANAATVTELAARPEWLLDGWEQICLTWRYARDDAARGAALAEIVDRLPVFPKEVNDWTGYRPDLGNLLLSRGPVRLNHDWRTGAEVLDLTARNERFRAEAA